MKIAYIRVSSLEQNLDAQRKIVTEAGAERVFEEKVSGRNIKNRPQLKLMLETIRENDEILITTLSRLGRSLLDLHIIVGKIKSIGAKLKVIDMNMDTNTPTGQLLFNVIGSLAEWDRDMIVERLAAGKKHTGRYGGRPKVTNDKQNKTMFKLWQKGAGLKELSENYRCSKMTVWRKINKFKNEQRKDDIVVG